MSRSITRIIPVVLALVPSLLCGAPLENGDFAAGMKGWTAHGTAFGETCLHGPAPRSTVAMDANRIKGGPPQGEGARWVCSSLPRVGTGAMGRLDSKPFDLPSRILRFWFAGYGNEAAVELHVDGRIALTTEVVPLRAGLSPNGEGTRWDYANWQFVEWDLAPFQGKKGFIRLRDDGTSSWVAAAGFVLVDGPERSTALAEGFFQGRATGWTVNGAAAPADLFDFGRVGRRINDEHTSEFAVPHALQGWGMNSLAFWGGSEEKHHGTIVSPTFTVDRTFLRWWTALGQGGTILRVKEGDRVLAEREEKSSLWQWEPRFLDCSAFRGKTVRLEIEGKPDEGGHAYFQIAGLRLTDREEAAFFGIGLEPVESAVAVRSGAALAATTSADAWFRLPVEPGKQPRFTLTADLPQGYQAFAQVFAGGFRHRENTVLRGKHARRFEQLFAETAWLRLRAKSTWARAVALPDGKITVTLGDEPLADVSEVDPLADAGPAVLSLGGEGRRIAISARRDVDLLALDVPEPGVGTLSVRATGVTSPVDLLIVLEKDGRSIANAQGMKGADVLLGSDLREGGRYLLKLSDGASAGRWDRGRDFSDALITVTASFEGVDDVHEPNEDAARAALVPLGKKTRGALFPERDQDWFAVEVPEPGLGMLQVRLDELPAALHPYLLVQDPQGRHLASRSGGAGEKLRFEIPVARAGRYLVRLQDHRGGSSPRAYSLLPAFEALTHHAEPNGSIESARTLQPGVKLLETIFPRGDEDFFAVAVPAPGRGQLTVELEDGPEHVDLQLGLWRPGKRWVGEWNLPEGRPGFLRFGTYEGGVHILRVRDGESPSKPWGDVNQEWSSRPYAITVRWEADGDAHEDNGDAKTATPLAYGVETEGRIWPEGDQDWYRFEAKRGQRIEIRLSTPSPVAPCVQLHRPDGRYVFSGETVPGFPLRRAFHVDESGTWTLLVRDGDDPWKGYGDANQQRSLTPYRLRLEKIDPVDLERKDDTPEDAPLLELGKEATGAIMPNGDRDWFRVDVPEDGLLALRLHVDSASIAPWIELYDDAGKRYLGGAEITGGWMAAYDRRVEKGSYRVIVRDGDCGARPYNDREQQSSPGSYHLTAWMVRPVEGTPPNLDRASALVLREGENPPASFAEKNRRLWYRFTAPAEGRVRFYVAGVDDGLDPVIERHDGPGREKPLRLSHRGAGDWEWMEAELASGETLLLSLSNGDANVTSPLPVTPFLRFEARPAGTGEPNDDPTKATPIEPGKVAEGHLWKKGDLDWYEWSLSGPGRWTLDLDGAADEIDPDCWLYERRKGGALPRVLYLRGDSEARLNEELSQVYKLAVTTVEWRDEKGKAILADGAAMAAYDVVVVDRLQRFEDFAMAEAATQRALMDWVARGGRLILLAPCVTDDVLAGAKVLSCDSIWSSAWRAENLVGRSYAADNNWGTGWCSAQKAKPATIVFDMGQRLNPDRVVFRAGAQELDRSARTVELAFSDSADGGFRKVWSGELSPYWWPQTFPLSGASGRYVQLKILDNHGHGNEIQLNEVMLYERSAGRLFGLGFEDCQAEWQHRAGSRILVAKDLPEGYRLEKGQTLQVDGPWDLTGWIAGWKGAGFRAHWLDVTGGADPLAALVEKEHGKGRILVTTANQGTAHQRERKRLFLEELLDLPLRYVAHWAQSDGLEYGNELHQMGLVDGPRRQVLLVQDRLGWTGSHVPYRVKVGFEPALAEDPNDDLARAVPVLPGKEIRGIIHPDEDADWLLLSMDEDRKLRFRLHDVPPHQNLAMDLYEVVGTPRVRPRVLYLVGGRTDYRIDSHFPEIDFERVEHHHFAARTIMDRLGDYDGVILDGLTSWEQFRITEAETQGKIEAYVRGGGFFLLTSPSLNGSFIAACNDGEAVSASSVESHRVLPKQTVAGRGRRWSQEDYWMSKEKAPQHLVFRLGGSRPRRVDRVVLTKARHEHEWPAEIEIFSGAGPEGPWTSRGRFPCTKELRTESFRPAPFDAAFLKLLVHATVDPKAAYTSIAEVEVYGPEILHPLFGLRLEGAWDDADDGIRQAVPPHPVSHRWEPCPPLGGWNGCELQSGFRGWKDAGWELLQHRKEDADLAVALVRRLGKGEMILDAQELGWRGSLDQGYAVRKLRNHLGRLLNRRRIAWVDGSEHGAEEAPEEAMIVARKGQTLAAKILRVGGWGGLATPYRFRVEASPVKLPGEPDDEPTKARLLASDVATEGNLYPLDDRDWYRVPCSSTGRLELRVGSVPDILDPVLEIFHGAEAAEPFLVVDRSEGGQRGAGEHCSIEVTAPVDYLVLVRDAGGGACLEPYEITARFVEVVRPLENNDTPERAVPVPPGDPVAANLYPGGDVDWYRLELAGPGEVKIELANVAKTIDPVIEVHRRKDGKLERLSRHDATQQRGLGGDEVFAFQAAEGGEFLLKVFDEDGGRRTEDLYRLTATYEAAPDRRGPVVLQSFPAEGAKNVGTSIELAVYLDEAIDEKSFDPASAVVLEGREAGRVRGQASWDAASRRLAFTPDEELFPDDRLRLRLAPSLRDEAGNALRWEGISFDTVSAASLGPVEPARIVLAGGELVGLGPVEIRLDAGARLRAAPVLKVRTPSGRSVAVEGLVSSDRRMWTGRLVVDRSFGEGEGRFELSGEAAGRRKVDAIAEGSRFVVDVTPPSRGDGLVARTLPRGDVSLQWTVASDGDAAGYAVLRARGGRIDPSAEAVKTLEGGGNNFTVDRPPEDGEYLYAVAVLDRAGNRGPPSAAVPAVSDRTPPAAVVEGLAVAQDDKGRLVASWKAAPDPDHAAFWLYWSDARSEPAADRWKKDAVLPMTETSHAMRHRGDGRYRYSVALADATGNPGTPCPFVEALQDTAAPWMRLRLDPPEGPYAKGEVKVELEASEELKEAPLFGWRGAGEKQPRLVSLTVDEKNPRLYRGTVIVDGSEPDGEGRFFVRAVDPSGNVGTHLNRSAFLVDTAPPKADLTAKVTGEKGARVLEVAMKLHEDVVRVPELRIEIETLTGPRSWDFEVTGDPKGRDFVARLVVEREGKVLVADGMGRFTMKAEDRFAHVGGTVIRGAEMRVDLTPPDPPGRFVVRSRAGRKLHLEWLPPSNEAVRFYRVYRSADPACAVTEANLRKDELRDARWEDGLDAESKVHYRVTAVDDAGNEGEASPAVVGMADSTPPPPPEALTHVVEKAGQILLRWQKPRLEAVDVYRVYRRATVEGSGEERVRVTETAATEAADLPKLTGRLVYEVSSVDEAGNESAVTATKAFDYDVRPPVATLEARPSFGHRIIWIPGFMCWNMRDLGEVIREGKTRLVLRFDEAVADGVRLAHRSEVDDVPQDLLLERKNDRTFETTLELAAPPRDLKISFVLRAEDRAGNVCTTIAKEPHFLLDGQAPPALAVFSATPRPGGKVRLEWTPPGGEPRGEPRYRVYRASRPFTKIDEATSVAQDLDKTEHEDLPPKDGTWHYAVVAVDRAGHVGAMVPPVAVRSSRVGPKAPSTVDVKIDREMALSWTASPSDEKVTYRVYAAPDPLKTIAQLDGREPVARRLDRCAWHSQPEKPERLWYTVVAVDEAGNLGTPARPLLVDLSAKIPTVKIRTHPPSPVRSAMRVEVESSLALVEPPSLSFQPRGRAPLPIGMVARDASRKLWGGSLDVTEDTGDGEGRFLFRGKGADGLPGGFVTEGETLVVDTRPPSASLRFSPSTPLSSGPAEITLVPSEPLAEAPVLSYTPQGGKATAVELVARKERDAVVWVGTTVIPGGLPDGLASVRFKGKDLAGNEGSSLTPDRFAIDTHPPKAPGPLRAETRKHGVVALFWQAPVYLASEEADRISAYLVYRSDRSFEKKEEAERVAEVRRLEASNCPPRDGTWFYRVSTRDAAGLESGLGPMVQVVSDRTPPPVPRPTQPVADRVSIRLAWESVEALGATTTDRYELLAEWRIPGVRPVQQEIVYGPGPEKSFVHRPVRGGEYLYRVRSRDVLDHVSFWSAPVFCRFDKAAPVASLTFDPAPPFSGGAVTVKLESTKELAGAPELSWTAVLAEATDSIEAARRATAPVDRHAVPLTGAGRFWEGRLDLKPDPSVVALAFAWKGSAAVGGETVEGTDLTDGAEAKVDFGGPVASIRFDDAVPRKDRQVLLKAGTYTFTVKVSEPLAEAPRMSFLPRGKDPLPVTVAAKDELHWIGSVSIDEGFGDGSGSFTFEGTDRTGNLGKEIASGANVRIDTTPPARIRKIRATAYPGGKVRVDWIPSFGADGKAEGDANRFYLYRSTREIVDAAGLEPLSVVDRVLGAFDHPKGSRLYHYAVLAVDEAGNAGPVSASAAVEIDKDPPEPPQAVTAVLTEKGVVKVSWERGGGEKPLLYNVYLEKHPITTTKGLSPNARGVPFTHMYGAPNEDGRYYFAVTAIDDALNESEPSVSVEIDYRRSRPIASFRIEPDIWLNDGVYPVSLETTKPLMEPPVVEVNQESGTRFRLPFSGAGARWTANLTITPAVAEGTCGFVFRGRSEGGVTGDEIKRGPLFHVDRTPTPPPGNLAVRPDDERTPGAVKLTWNSPKSKDRAVEVPHFYRIYRSKRAMADVKGLDPIREVVVEFENMDEYVAHDVPPENGTWHYVVTALDMARNESAPSNDFEVLSSTTTPRFSLGIHTELGGVAPVTKVGRESALVRVRSSQGLKDLSLAWHEVTREEKLGQGKAKRHPVPVRPVDAERKVWEGPLVVEGGEAEEQEAAFEVEGTGADGARGSFLSTGKTFFIDTVGPEARIKIPSIYTMRVDAYANELVVAPVMTGRVEVTLETPEELVQPPRVGWAPAGRDETPLPMQGFGSFWKGAMDIRPETPNGECRFSYRGMDRTGNPCEIIEKRVYDRKLDLTVDPPRTIENYATTGGVFEVDTVAPAAPTTLEVDQRKLGVAVIKWKEPAGEPKTYNLYRSLTPLASRVGLRPVRDNIYAPVIVDDPPCDGNYFYAVTALDMAGNESPLSECKSVFIDSIKPELKITPVPSGDDFVILMDENPPPGMAIELRFPGGKTMQVDLGGSSGKLKEVPVPGSRRKGRGLVLPQLLEVFNGTVEVVVHSPDPAGNITERITTIEAKKIDVATGGEVQSFDNLVKLEVPPGVEPVVPKGPDEVRRVGGYENLFFIRYENIPKADVPRAVEPEDPTQPDPLPPGLEVVGKPYRIELNADTSEPMKLANAATQADLSALTELTAKLRMKIPTRGSEAVEDVDYLKTRLKVVAWQPMTADEAKGKAKGSQRGRWRIVPDVEIDKSTGELIVPAKDVTTYVIVSERTPPSIVDLEPPEDGTVKTFRPRIGARIVDKGTGVAVGAENRIVLHVDGMPVASERVEISDEDPTEVTVSYVPAADLTPGPHMVTLKAQDVVENESIQSWKFHIDNEPPQILAVGPVDGARVGVGRPALTARLADEGGGVDPARIRITVDGQPLVDAPFDEVAGRVVAHPPASLPSGEHRAELVIEDRGGKKATRSWTFVTDREAPEVQLLDPPAGKALGRRKAPLVVDLRDAFGNVDPTTVVVDVDGVLVPRRFAGGSQVGYDYDTVTGRLLYAPEEGWTPGEHRLFVAAADAHGHLAAKAFPFRVDVTPPAVAVLASESEPLAAFGAYLLRIDEEDAAPVIEGPGRLVFDVVSRHLLIEPGAAGAAVTLTVKDGAGFVSENAVNLRSGTVDRSVEQEKREIPPPPVTGGASPGAGAGTAGDGVGAMLRGAGRWLVDFFETPPGPLDFPERLKVAMKIALVFGLFAWMATLGRRFSERRSGR